MSAKIGVWEKVSFTGDNSLFVIGSINFDAQLLTDMANIAISQSDAAGISHLDKFSNSLQGELLTFRAIVQQKPGVFFIPKILSDLTVQVSGEPTFAPNSNVGYYNFPISVVSLTPSSYDSDRFAIIGGDKSVVIFGTSQSTGNNTVTMSDALTTTWDDSKCNDGVGVSELVASTATITTSETLDASWEATDCEIVPKKKSSTSSTARVTMSETVDSSWDPSDC